MIETFSSLKSTVIQRGINPDSEALEQLSALIHFYPGMLHCGENWYTQFIGYMLSYVLQGILFIQMFLYYLAFRRTDPSYLKLTVATVIIIQAIVTEGSLSFSLSFEPAFRCICILCGLVAAMVQGSYAWRIHLLGGSWKIFVPVMILSATQCVMVSYWGSLNVLLAGTQSMSLAAPALYSTWLRKQIRITKNQSLITRVKRAMTIAIDTGVLTALSALFQLILFVIFQVNSIVDITLLYPLPKLLMATLNARIIVKAGIFPDDSAEVEDKPLDGDNERPIRGFEEL
ncbi:hypothetical protein BDP27DRAFT_1405222 [Rhodocollybia butyracea]|uniref:Uncharacterized protein n=1 Tax=Rhodocollybia butyracea TaxID=206335 RepID=A0A9P5U4F0_9AGAR|nr:hypothetical protein BDP27DRAFT_1405222 [Rhodocollybia butyracea]